MKRVFLVFLVFCCVSARGDGQLKRAIERPKLAGIEAVRVLIEDADDLQRELGLSESKLKAQVEVHLRKAGIRVVEIEELDRPYLYVNVHVMKAGRGPTEFYVYGIGVQLRQYATLVRDPNINVSADTWSRTVLGTSGAARTESMRE